jgi:hypothetical protein
MSLACVRTGADLLRRNTVRRTICWFCRDRGRLDHAFRCSESTAAGVCFGARAEDAGIARRW